MEQIFEKAISCPYCGEQISVLIDTQEVGQEYIEDCQVCCRPIVFHLWGNPGENIEVVVQTEDDTF
ncbi:CPXCG motif-containing cysteine-rich protein [Pseudomaricurvus sp. HS19]|uniref:CPXCG motif-containing cysteine-rich protein n=1 Tax=Pseudomaricurvus sp. HS19 TaxID=2692626 RepID=UPI0013718D47|nr:CPXCG motif-containing cysteine-rich protein [Pseudomaricurvus sp. HS19]